MILQKYTVMNELFEYDQISDKEWLPTARTDVNWAELFGVDLSGCNIRNRRKNNIAPNNSTYDSCVEEELSDINRWNSGFWAAVMIAPNKAVACAHYWRVVQGQQNTLKFWGKSGTVYTPTFKSATEFGNDRVIIEFEDDLPVDDVKIYKIVDFRWIPQGTKLWMHDNQGRIIFKIHEVAKEFKYPALNFQQVWAPDPVIGDWCKIHSGDSGTPTFMTDPVTNETYLVGLYAGGYQSYEERSTEVGMKEFDPRIEWVKVTPARGDTNRDGIVDGADLAAVLESFGQLGVLAGDLNDDNMVDGADLGLIFGDWGQKEPNVLWYEDWYGQGGGGPTGDKPGDGGVQG